MCNDRPNEAIARSIEPRSFSFGYTDLGKSRLIGLWLPANRRGFIDAPTPSLPLPPPETRDYASAFNARVRRPPCTRGLLPPLIRFSLPPSLPPPPLSLSLSLSWCTTGMIMRIEPWPRAVYTGETRQRGRGRGEGRIKVMRQCAGSPQRAMMKRFVPPRANYVRISSARAPCEISPLARCFA